MSIYREKRGLNWGAALQSLGQDLGNYAEQQRQERLAAEERKRQELALKALYQRQDELATQQSGMVLPESFRLPGAMGQTNPMSMGVVGGMRVKPATEVLRDMYPVAKQSTRAAVPPPEEFVVVGVDGQPQVYSVPFGRVPSAVAALETPDYSPLPAGVDDSGRKVYRLDRNWERPVAPTRGPKLPDPKDVAAEWYGGEKQSGDFDPKTGVATPFSYPFRGSVYDQAASAIDLLPDLGNAVKNKLAVGDTIDDEAEARAVLAEVQAKYDLGLAQSLERDLGAAFSGWQQDVAGGKVIPGQYRRDNIPSVFGMNLNPLDRLARDDVKAAAEFYADIVNKQLADGTNEVEMRTINAWLKKKGLTLDQLSQYINTSRAQGIDLPAAGAAIVNQGGTQTAPAADNGVVEMSGKKYRKVGNDWVVVE